MLRYLSLLLKPLSLQTADAKTETTRETYEEKLIFMLFFMKAAQDKKVTRTYAENKT